jgi:archaellum component FlaC
MQVQYKATIGLLLAFTFSTASLLPAQPAAGAAGNAEEPKSTGSDKPPSPDSEAETNRHNVKLRPISESQQQANEDTADAVNRIPGTQVESKDLQPPAPEEPIHGFHPIKKMLQPVVRLEKNSVELEQQIMRLEGPIAGLQPAMLGLQKKITSVEKRMGSMQDSIVHVGGHIDNVGGHIDNVGGHIDNIGGRVNNVGTQMKGISEQMSAVRADINRVRTEIDNLNGPITDLHKPLAEVARPLLTVEQKLEKLAALLTTVLFTILVAAGIIAIGTPIAAILIYRYRRRLFPDMTDRDFPVAKASDSSQSLHPSNT